MNKATDQAIKDTIKRHPAGKKLKRPLEPVK